LMGTGRGTGEKRAIEAAQQAISSPLLEDVSINGATGILINITGGSDLTLAEMNEACSLIEEAADPEANIIFGSVIDAHAGDEVRITVIATGFQPILQPAFQAEQPVAPLARASGGLRRGHDQMALPMAAQPSAPPPLATFGSAPTMAIPTASVQPPALPLSWAQSGQLPSGPTARGFAAAAPSRAPAPEPLTIPIDNLDDFYVGAEYGPATPAPVPASPSAPIGYGSVPTAEWTAPSERPIIRPPVGGGGPQPRRMASPVSVRGADDLGVEENEFDKPTYLRRGLVAPE